MSVRVYPHVHLHVDTLLEIVHDAGDASLKVVPPASVSDEPMASRRHASTHVAPMSSRLGTGGIWLGAAIFAAIVCSFDRDRRR